MARAINANVNPFTNTQPYKLQLQLGQITEMIHVASLIHDDVLDEAGNLRIFIIHLCWLYDS